MPQPSSRVKDIQRAAATAASLGTMGYFGIGICIGVAAFLIYRYCRPQNSLQVNSSDPVQALSGHSYDDDEDDEDEDEDDDPGPSNGNGASANSNMLPHLEAVPSPENPITRGRNEVERRRTSSQLRHGTNTNSRSVDQPQPINLNAGPSTPPTSTDFNSLTSTTATPTRPPSPTPQVPSLLFGSNDSLSAPARDDTVPHSSPSPTSTVSPPVRTTHTRRSRAATVIRYLDQDPDSSTPPVPNSTSRTSNSSQHTISNTLQPSSQQLPTPAIRSPSDGIPHEELLRDEGRSTFSLQSEMKIGWPSILLPDFPDFELPGLRPPGDANTPDEPRERRQ